MVDKPPAGLVVQDLTLRVEEAQDALSAIRNGQVDALVISRAGQQQEIVLLQGAAKAYHVLFETLNEGALAVAAGGLVLYANRRFAELVERPMAEVLEADLDRFVAPDDAAALASLLEEARRGSSKGEISLVKPGGEPIPVMISVRAVEEEAEDITYTVVVTDLTAIREAQAALQGAHDRLSASDRQLRASLREKEVLLKETHHRVKNNLQVISSMLHMQSQQVTDRSAREVLRESQSRVQSIALVHEAIYQSEDLGSIDLDAYLRRLISTIRGMYGAGAIRVDVDIAPVRPGIDTAMHCGLIVNELCTNTLKHAFSRREDGHVSVSIRRDGDRDLVLEVADDGAGFPEEVDFRDTKSLGLQLVCGLTEQLGGTIALDRSLGTRFTVRFPERPTDAPEQPEPAR